MPTSDIFETWITNKVPVSTVSPKGADIGGMQVWTSNRTPGRVKPKRNSAITGSTCWGQVTGVLELNIRTFLNHWIGTGLIEYSGNAERIQLDTGQYMYSEVVNTGGIYVELLQNVYASGDTVTLQYRHGITQTACEAASWNAYSGQFISLGYMQVRIEA